MIKYKFLLVFVVALIFLPGCWRPMVKRPVIASSVKKPGHLVRQEAQKAPPEVRKSIKILSFDQLDRLASYYESRQEKEKQCSCLERMVALSSDQIATRSLRLKLADLYFDADSYDKAAKTYMNYLLLYPGSKQAPYASYKGLLSMFYITLTPDRDQTKTYAALQLASTYLQQCKDHIPGYEDYEQEVKKIQNECLKKIVDSHMHIVDFYNKQKNYPAAHTRIAAMKKELVPLMQDDILFEARMLALEADSYKNLGDMEMVQVKNQELALRFPTYRQQLAQADIQPKKKSDGHRF